MDPVGRYPRSRLIKAALRDAWLIWRDTGHWLVLLIVAWLLFATLIRLWYHELPIWSFGAALYVAFSQMLLEPQPLPRQWWLQIFFYVMPALAFVLLARGALNAGLLVFDKRNRREAWQMALASTFNKHIIVCGLGKVGYRVVRQLLLSQHDVVAIDMSSNGEFSELVSGMGVPVLFGDARQPELLLQAGLERAHSLAVVTSDDLTNLDIALTARELRGDISIVMRVFNDSLSRKLGSAFNITTAFSTTALAAPTFAAAAIGSGITNALYVAGKLLSTIEVPVVRNGVLDGRLVQTVEDEHDVSILYVRTPHSHDQRPRGDHRLSADDVVVIIGPLESIHRIQQLNQPNAAPHSPIRRT